MTDDERLFHEMLEQIHQGSEEAARQFLDRYGKYILHVVRQKLHEKLRDEFDSQDFLQDVCLSFFRSPPSPEDFPDQEALRRFLRKLARNKVADTARHRDAQRYAAKREKSLDGSARCHRRHLVGPEPTPSEAAAVDETANMLASTVRPNQEQIVRMVRDGCTREEIARVLGLSVRQVMRLLQRLRERLAP